MGAVAHTDSQGPAGHRVPTRRSPAVAPDAHHAVHRPRSATDSQHRILHALGWRHVGTGCR